MAWTAANIYVQSDDPGAVARSLRAAFDDPALAAKREGILDSPPPALVAPAIEGYVVAAGVRGWVQEVAALARRVSADLGARALGLDISGSWLILDLSLFEAGEERRRLTSPAEPPSGAMPLYEDVEARAHAALREAGVPARAITAGTRPLGASDPAPAGTGHLVGASADEARAAEAPADPDAPRRTFGPHEVAIATPATDEAPVFATEGSEDFGLQLFEHRFLSGRPTDEAVDRLLAIEEAYLARARRARPDAAVDLTVTYHAPEAQERLDALLSARGRHVAPRARPSGPPWWQIWRHLGRGRR